MNIIDVPELSLVVLIGPSGCGKTTFARKHFGQDGTHEVLTSDGFRMLVADSTFGHATKSAFEVLHLVARRRLELGRLTVVDATNADSSARKTLVQIAKDCDVPAVAIHFDLPVDVCVERVKQREGQTAPVKYVFNQHRAIKSGLRDLRREGFKRVFHLDSIDKVDRTVIQRVPAKCNEHRTDTGPFDVIGDIHGCGTELVELLTKLGYVLGDSTWMHPAGRKVVFLGDLIDRGPLVAETLQTVMRMVEAGSAYCVMGNHDAKYLKLLQGRDVRIAHGLNITIESVDAVEGLRDRVRDFLHARPHHLVLDHGKLIAAHAGLIEQYHGRDSKRVESFAYYGMTNGERDDDGFPVRLPWADDYRGRAAVVYGHCQVDEPVWINNTLCIDTGCIFGGKLTALRYPEREIIQVDAHEAYTPLGRPLTPMVEARGEVLDIDDVMGKRNILTRYGQSVRLREGEAASALETMSRFAVDPRWLIYLPPTMSPPETCTEGMLLERPEEAFEYYRTHGIEEVVCEEKHMGSRAILVICRDTSVALRRFGIPADRPGCIYTRTGRAFFNDPAMEKAVLERAIGTLDTMGWWEKFNTDWFCLDAELMPWSFKATDLLARQYGVTAVAANVGLNASLAVLEQARARGLDVGALADRYGSRATAVQNYDRAWRPYCWPVESIDQLQIAVFHVLATEGRTYFDVPHGVHMIHGNALSTAARSIFAPTNYRHIHLGVPSDIELAKNWWEGLTSRGGEGFVVKPMNWVQRAREGLVQPAMKVRGPNYLRIIYGPEYSLPENVTRLRQRAVGKKRALAAKEYALGLEALSRFVEKAPLYRVHECVFGVLALETDPVDIRL